MDISNRVPVITVPMPPSTGDMMDEEAGSVTAMTMESHFHKISGLDDPTLVETAYNDEPNEEEDEKRRQVWNKSRNRVCGGLLLLALAITGVVYLLQSFGNDTTSVSESTNIAAANINTVELNSDNNPTLLPTGMDNDSSNTGSDVSGTDDFFNGLNEDNDTQEQLPPNRDPDNGPGVVENVADYDWGGEGSINSQQGSTTTPQEDGNTQDLGDNNDAANAVNSGVSFSTRPVNESGQQDGNSGQDDFECGKDPNVAQTKGGSWGGGGGDGNRCRDGNGNRRGLGGGRCGCRNNNGGNNRHRLLWGRFLWLPRF